MLSSLVSDNSAVPGVLPVLIDAALKGAILVFLAAIGAFVLSKRSAASRHAVWTAAVVGHLTIPILALVLPAWRMPLLPAASWMQPRASTPVVSGDVTSGVANEVAQDVSRNAPPITPDPTTSTSASAANTPATTSPPVAAAKTIARSFSPVQVLAAIWLAGAILVLLRLAIGTWRVGQLAREGARVEDGNWLSLTQRLANRLGVTRPLTLLRGERLAVPVTWGIVYPAVLLPEDSDAWTEERRRFVLVHEMAHIKRFDALTQLLAQFSIALFWFDPLVWLAAHRMRVEREHACDDYVLRDGTTPSLYAGELLEMVRSIGSPAHDRAAPAFAALAMARRSEFEGRMLAILDPKQDRHTLNRRGTLMTAVIVALLAFPLAALRPFDTGAAKRADDFPESFKISISPAVQSAKGASGASAIGDNAALTPGTSAASVTTPASATTPVPKTSMERPTLQSAWSCDRIPAGSSTHNSIHVDDNGGDNSTIMQYLSSTAGRCAEAAVVGKVHFSDDETRISGISPGGFARFREHTPSFDRAVTLTPTGNGSLAYNAMANGQTVPFDADMQGWLARFLPEVLREAAINVPERVGRLRAQGGVPAVLREISQIKSNGAKAAHYDELLKGPQLSADDAERVLTQAAQDLRGSGGDLSRILQKLPRSAIRSTAARQAMAGALTSIPSSGDKATTLQILAPNADQETLLMLARVAETLPSSGDKENFLTTAVAEYLSNGNEALRNAFFHATATMQSSGDMANVLMASAPYGHANQNVVQQVIETSAHLASSGDTENVLESLIAQRLLNANNPRTTVALIERTLTMASSGDRANVLISLAGTGLLSNRDVRDAFMKATQALPSDGDRANVLSAAARY
jgi:beta-lactamase regulating signal transducer with metallopeptidase domain